jgi:hypothetical protein
MREYTELYIDGAWREPLDGTVIDLTDPATGEVSGRVALGGGCVTFAGSHFEATWGVVSRRQARSMQ